jgi:hypothetical protein
MRRTGHADDRAPGPLRAVLAAPRGCVPSLSRRVVIFVSEVQLLSAAPTPSLN